MDLENEDDDPVGCQVPADPEAKLAELAKKCGVTMTPEIRELCFEVAEFCSCLVDPYSDDEMGNAGEEIRAAFPR